MIMIIINVMMIIIMFAMMMMAFLYAHKCSITIPFSFR